MAGAGAYPALLGGRARRPALGLLQPGERLALGGLADRPVARPGGRRSAGAGRERLEPGAAPPGTAGCRRPRPPRRRRRRPDRLSGCAGWATGREGAGAPPRLAVRAARLAARSCDLACFSASRRCRRSATARWRSCLARARSRSRIARFSSRWRRRRAQNDSFAGVPAARRPVAAASLPPRRRRCDAGAPPAGAVCSRSAGPAAGRRALRCAPSPRLRLLLGGALCGALLALGLPPGLGLGALTLCLGALCLSLLRPGRRRRHRLGGRGWHRRSPRGRNRGRPRRRAPWQRRRGGSRRRLARAALRPAAGRCPGTPGG